MFFIDSSDIKFATFLDYVFHNMINEISSRNTNRSVDNHFGTGRMEYYLLARWYLFDIPQR